MANKYSKFNGLSDDQVLQLFRQIASTADLISAICRDQAEESGTQPVAVTFHALDTMLRGVGAMADMPTGGDCVGSFADWMVGPLFSGSTTSGHPSA